MSKKRGRQNNLKISVGILLFCASAVSHGQSGKISQHELRGELKRNLGQKTDEEKRGKEAVNKKTHDERSQIHRGCADWQAPRFTETGCGTNSNGVATSWRHGYALNQERKDITARQQFQDFVLFHH